MPNLEKVTQYINNVVKSSPNFSGMKFQHSTFHELADNFIDTKEQTIRPVVILNDGECIKLDLDDKNNMQVYHRIDSQEFSIQDDDYGRIGNVMTEISNMRMILYGDRSRLNVRQEDIVAYAISYIPKEIDPVTFTTWGLNSVSIEMGTVDENPVSVFNKEYKNVEYMLKPSNFMVDISYKIKCSYVQGCFTIC